MISVAVKHLTKPLQLILEYWTCLIDHWLSGGDHRKNLYVHVRDDVGVQKGLYLCASFALLSFLWLGGYMALFGMYPPNGETLVFGQHQITDFQLYAISECTVPIFGFLMLVFLRHLESVNRRKNTLPIIIAEANKTFKVSVWQRWKR